MKHDLTLRAAATTMSTVSVNSKFYLMLMIIPVAVVALFFAPMGLLHDNLHHARHSLSMVLCH